MPGFYGRRLRTPLSKTPDMSKAENAPGVVEILTGAALTNAVLGTQGFHDIDMPARPNRVWQALQQSNG
jgi:hypothetical protein